jgi:cell division protein FtsW
MVETETKKAGYDRMILIPVILLIGLGLVLLYSASSHLAEHRLGDNYFFLRRQGLFCLLGIVLLVLTKNIPFKFYMKLAYPLLLVSLGLMILVFIPGFGYKIGGASRWLRIGDLSFQPSELAKFSLAIYMAYSMAKKGSEIEQLSKGLLPHLIVSGVFLLLLIIQPDLGTAVIIGFWVLILLFVGGVRLRHLSSIFLLSLPMMLWLVLHSDYRIKRWWAFINPWDDPKGIGFQIIHSFLAFGSGGIFGSGLGDSKQKLLYLPEPHTDFIFSIVGEELGFVGVAAVVILFGVLILRGIKVALDAPDLYTSYLAFALTSLIGLQAIVNMGVAMGLLPTKGLTLPLISYGGSSMVMNLICIGMLLNISSMIRKAGIH